MLDPFHRLFVRYCVGRIELFRGGIFWDEQLSRVSPFSRCQRSSDFVSQSVLLSGVDMCVGVLPFFFGGGRYVFFFALRTFKANYRLYDYVNQMTI